MATPRLGLVVEDKPTELSCTLNYSGLTARDLAMQCDFYKCADLLDELKEIMKKESEERLKKSREQGIAWNE